MNRLCHKDPFGSHQCFRDGHPLLQAEAKQAEGHVVLLCPVRQTLRFASMFKEALSCFFDSIAEFFGCCQSLLSGPSIFQPVREALGIHANISRPSAQALGFSIMGKHHISSEIALLLCWRCPSAICRTIAKGSIDSIKSRVGRALSHVCQKVLERLPPTLAHKDSSAAVLGELCVTLPMASSQHVVVSVVSPTLRKFRGVAVLHQLSLRGDLRGVCSTDGLRERFQAPL